MDQAGRPRFDVPERSMLIERSVELATLREKLADVAGGSGSVVLIAGEAGIGKTALAHALCAEARARDVMALVGRAADLSQMPPYGVWLDLFAHLDSTEDSPPLPDVFAERGVIGTASSRLEILDQTVAFFRSVAANRPALVLLDDLQWADVAALDVLRLLAREIRHIPLLLVGTYRSEDTPTGSPLAQLLLGLAREVHLTWLNLVPLSHEAIAELTTARYELTAADAGRLTDYLFGRSQGNPFFVGELLRGLEERGDLAPTATGWRVGDLLEARIPMLVREVIAARVARLGEVGRRALAVAAVIGDEIPIAVWCDVSGLREEDVLALIERAVQAHVLTATEDGERVAFYHALTREALYETLLPPRRRNLHRAIGEALSRLRDAPPDAVARHFERAGDARVVKWQMRAGEQAQAAYAYLTAADRFEGALRALEDEPAATKERGWLALRIAWLRFYQLPEQSARQADEVLRIAEAGQNSELAACALFSRGHFLVTVGEFRRGLRDIRASVAAFDALPDGAEAWSARLRTLHLAPLEPFHPRGVLTATLAYSGQFAEARNVGEQSVARDYEMQHPVSAMQTYLGLAIAYANLGDPVRAADAFAAARACVAVTAEHLLTSVVDLYELTFRVIVFCPDDLVERRRLVEDVHYAWAKGADVYSQADLPRFAGFETMFVEGRWKELRALAEMGACPPPIRFFQYAVFGLVAYHTGDRPRVSQLVREVHPSGPSSEPGDGAINTVLAYQRLGAMLALDAGDLATARAWLEAHDRFVAWSGVVPGRAEGHTAWAAYFRCQGDVQGAVRHARQAWKDAEQPRQPLALVAARRTLGELSTELGQYADGHEHLNAALALADACCARFERGLTLLALAELHCSAGRRGQAIVALNASRAILDELGAAPALERASALATRLAAESPRPAQHVAGLTARELEVLRLIAAGRSNRDIAEGLSVSVHTVHTHIGHILEKTGCDNRAAAAAFALRNQLA
jgi:DNA-binding CsgD family transcriptional regulator/RecA/RadA recombinase